MTSLAAPVIEFDEAKHKYTVNGEPVPSVTQILGVLDKPALPWWGMKVGVQGVQHLRAALGAEMPWDDADGIVKLLTEHKLTVNHVRDQAGTRGTSVHSMLETWMAGKPLPDPASFPVDDRGYVQAFARALLVLDPEPVASEVMVASTEHRFAGRYDVRARIDGKLVLLDLKTGKGIYPESQFPQLEAYEGASIECGAEPTDVRMILRLDASGDFETAESYATFEDFLGIKAAFDALQRMKAAKPRKRRAS